ncbi:MAG: U32 family peptidase [Clostridia bacterium]|nr:U32 family peptidase [Clostridia bacterium]
MSSRNFSARNKRAKNGRAASNQTAKPRDCHRPKSTDLTSPVIEVGDISTLPLPELLAPAGTPEALEAALISGADAVYLGGRLFNARMMAKNFDDADMAAAVKACHLRGAKLYVTLNTLVGDRMLPDAVEYAAKLRTLGVDALIVADMGLAAYLAKYLPDLELHASTQASCHNADGVRFLAEHGFSRVVCARELSAENIRALTATGVEIEAFVHGAHCVCHSGQCLMSSVIGGRSGNRGECAQPCRLPYNGGYPLSLKDLCLAGHVPELISLGAASLKIEGRLKSPDYVREVVSVWRRLLDERRAATAEELAHLDAVFSRGGFTDGYFRAKIDQSMLGVRSDADKDATRRLRSMARDDSRERAPLETAVREEIPLPKLSKSPRGISREKKSARFLTPERIFKGAELIFDEIYLPLEAWKPGTANGVILPSVITDSERNAVLDRLKEAKAGGALHALVGNAGHIALAKEVGLTLHGDFRLNVCSQAALDFYMNPGCFEDVILSPELTLPQIRDLGDAKCVIVYGRLPLMLLEKPVGTSQVKDRRGVSFPIVKEGKRDLLLNSVPTIMSDKKAELAAVGAGNQHFIFTLESAEEAKVIAEMYRRGDAPKAGMKFMRIAGGAKK